METKHAYLIIAHNNFNILKRLLQLIDDERNDIYLHIDKKVKDFNGGGYSSLIKKSKLYFIENRIDVRWGDVSQIKVELLLFREASSRGTYQYYHLLSGVDLPLKSQDEIHRFFNEHKGGEFIDFDLGDCQSEDRLRHIWLFVRKIKIGNNRILENIRNYALNLQYRIGYDHIGTKLGILRKGANWVSITDPAVRYLLEKSKEQLHYYRYSFGCDEIYKHTTLSNSKFINNVSKYGNMRMIDWQRGGPYTFTSEDFDMLINSDSLFARKFDESVDFEVVEKIYNYHMSKNK